jgi:iron(III) transport system substrate-binding protein
MIPTLTWDMCRASVERDRGGLPVSKTSISRRNALAGAGAAVAALPFHTRVLAQAPPGEAITPALIEAARKEGKVNFYTAMEIAVAEQYAKAFEGKFPGIAVRVERSGAERVFSRIGQEYASRIYNVDLVNTTDAAHALAWKREGWLAPYRPADVAEHFAAEHVDPDATFSTLRILFSVVAYNTQLVKPQDAPTGFLDLLHPKWMGKLVKAHPGYSGLILTATYAMARELGWDYFEKLAKQRVMQVQSGVDPPKKVALGERAAMVDGADYIALQQQDKGVPIEVVYPLEGAPLVNSPNAIFKAAPNPNAARLFQSWMYSGEGQQALVDISGQYVPHRQTKPKPGRRPLADIKAMKDDPTAILTQADDIKARYTAIFKV